MEESTDELKSFDVFHDAIAKLTAISHRLPHFAQALHVIGMEKLSDEIYAASDAIGDAAESIRKAHGEMIYQRFKESEQMTTNMVLAALAAATRISAQGSDDDEI